MGDTIMTDRALVRWLERVYGLDVDRLKSQIANGLVSNAAAVGASAVVKDGAKFILDHGRVVTVLGKEQRVKRRDRKRAVDLDLDAENGNGAMPGAARTEKEINMSNVQTEPQNRKGSNGVFKDEETAKAILDRMRITDYGIASEIVLVTPKMARHLRDTAHFERQRKISPANVDRLSAEMSARRFTQGIQIYICVLPDGSELIVNGNHTLEAIEKSGQSQVMTLTRAAVADEDEAGQIYAVFDIQKLRTWADSLRAVGASEGLPKADKFLAAIVVMKQSFGYQNVKSAISRPEAIEMLGEHREHAQFFNALCAGAPPNVIRLLFRANVLAVALTTLKYQPVAAFDFWRRVAQDDGLTSGMPERALLQWLRNNKPNGSLARVQHSKAAALAWNAYFRGEERGHLKPGAMLTFSLLGTPFANGIKD